MCAHYYQLIGNIQPSNKSHHTHAVQTRTCKCWMVILSPVALVEIIISYIYNKKFTLQSHHETSGNHGNNLFKLWIWNSLTLRKYFFHLVSEYKNKIQMSKMLFFRYRSFFVPSLLILWFIHQMRVWSKTSNYAAWLLLSLISLNIPLLIFYCLIELCI